jgi:hypothetical protein
MMEVEYAARYPRIYKDPWIPMQELTYKNFYPCIDKFVERMKLEIMTNWRNHAMAFTTKSAFANHLMFALTHFTSMWRTDGFFPESANALSEEMTIDD